jgi:hypothetical protein
VRFYLRPGQPQVHLEQHGFLSRHDAQGQQGVQIQTNVPFILFGSEQRFLKKKVLEKWF